jgi:uncharacterized repeat protein (TIGR01451 family)
MKYQVKKCTCGTIDSARPKIRRPHGLVLIVATVALSMAVTPVAHAKSLYVITEITAYDRPTPIHAYNIGIDGLLTFQAEYGAPFYGAGTIGLAIDSNSEQLFITFEDSHTILLLDAATLRSNRTTTAANAENLAGIVYDHGRELLYCVDRRTPNLYVYRWDPVEARLTPVTGSPFSLEGAESYGIALDEIRDLLYVGNGSMEITVYSTWDWRLTRRIAVQRRAISVAVDFERDYLYYGGGFAYNFHLAQYELATDTEREVEIAPDAGVMGLGVDPATGFIYTTTGQNSFKGGDDLLVFDPNLRLLQTIEDIGNPTGLVVPIKHTSYNPLGLKKEIRTSLGVEPDNPELARIAIGDQFSYSISFDPSGYDLQEISIIDKLPNEVTFVDATGHGTYGRYDSSTHTYTWLNPPVATGARTRLELVCRLQPHTAPGKIIVNLVTLDTDKTPPTTTGTEGVATPVTYQPLNVSKTVIGGTTGPGDGTEPVFAIPGDQLVYEICFDNKDNAHAVGNILVQDDLPNEVDFIDATGHGVFGQYDPVSHTYLWSYPLLSPGETACLDIVVQLHKEAKPGAIITNKVSVESEQTPKTDATADVTVGYTPLQLRKLITGGVDSELDDRGRPGVHAGSDVTYSLCFRNPSTDITVTQISIVDALPPEVSFVGAEGDGDFGFYDPAAHTYTWFYNPVGPGEEACVDLVVRVDEQVEPNTVISNWAAVSSKQTAATRARADAVVVLGSAMQAEMYLKPTRIIRYDPTDQRNLMAVLFLPQGEGMETIADTPMMLTPGNIRATGQRVFGDGSQGKVMCFFDIDAILAAIQGHGDFDVTVTGRCWDGRSFSGKCPLTIMDFTER